MCVVYLAAATSVGDPGILEAVDLAMPWESLATCRHRGTRLLTPAARMACTAGVESAHGAPHFEVPPDDRSIVRRRDKVVPIGHQGEIREPPESATFRKEPIPAGAIRGYFGGDGIA